MILAVAAASLAHDIKPALDIQVKSDRVFSIETEKVPRQIV
jgi:hypothetical protein